MSRLFCQIENIRVPRSLSSKMFSITLEGHAYAICSPTHQHRQSTCVPWR